MKNGLNVFASSSKVHMGYSYLGLENFEDALNVCLQALEEFKMYGMQDGMSGVCECTDIIGKSLIGMGFAKEAIAHQEGALAVIRRDYPNVKIIIAEVTRNLSVAHADLGQIEKSIELAEESYAEFKKLGYTRGEASALYSIAAGLQTRKSTRIQLHLPHIPHNFWRCLGIYLALLMHTCARGWVRVTCIDLTMF